MSILINKLTIDLYQEADNDIGSELATIEVNPALIGLFTESGKADYFYTFKSENGFSFEDKEEIVKLFTKVESIVKQCK